MSDDILDTTSIKVLVYENSPAGKYITETGGWETPLFIKNFQVIKLNNDNNYSVNLNYYFEDLEDIEVLPVISSIFLTEYMRGYNIEASIDTSTGYLQVNNQITTLNNVPERLLTNNEMYLYNSNINYNVEYVENVSEINPYSIPLDVDYLVVGVDWMGDWNGANADPPYDMEYYRDDVLNFSGSASRYASNNYIDNFYPKDSDVESIQFIPNCGSYNIYIHEFKTEVISSEDLEIVCFVIQGGNKI